MNKLHSFVDVDRSRRARWILEELEIPFEEVRLDYKKSEHQSPDYLNINPIGLSPGLMLNGKRLFESSGICLFLADQYPEKELAPPNDSLERSEYVSWLFFGATTLENDLYEVVPLRNKDDDESKKKFREAKAYLDRTLRHLETQLKERDFVLGNRFTAADIVIAFPLVVARECELLAGFSVLNAYLDRLAQRPAAERSRVFTGKL